MGTASGRLVHAQDRLTSSGALSVDGLIYLNNNTVITGNLNTSGNIAGTGTLSIDGVSYLNGGAVITGNQVTSGNIAGSGTLSIDGLSYLNAGVLVTGNANVTGNLAATGTLSIDGLAYLNGGGTVTGNFKIRGNMSGSSLRVDQGADIWGNLSVSGTTVLDGKVGIGTTAPETTLEVMGTMSGRRLSVSTSQTTSTGAIYLNMDGNGTGMLIDSEATNAPGLVIDMNAKSGSAPHLLFGYQGTFDTNLYRASGSTLATDDKLYLKALNADNRESLIIDTEETTGSQNVFKVISDVVGDEDISFRVTADGHVYSDNAYASTGADYAEWFFTSQEDLKPGELVCIDLDRKNAVIRCPDAADPNVVGIVSTRPAFVGNTITGADGIPVPGTVLVGLIGQIPAKVIVEKGLAIRTGDALTPASIPGYARRAQAGEPTVGVALEPLSAGQGSVSVLISRRNSSLTVEAVEQHVATAVAELKIEDEVQLLVTGAVDRLDPARLVNLLLAYTGSTLLKAPVVPSKQELVSAVTDAVTRQSLTVTGSLTVANQFTVSGPAFFRSDLTVRGAMRVTNLYVDGTIHAAAVSTTSGATLRGTVNVEGTLLLNGKTFSPEAIDTSTGAAVDIESIMVRKGLTVLGNVTISGLAKFLGTVDVQGELRVSSNQAGYAFIPKTGTAVTVEFSRPFYATPVVSASADTPVLYGVTTATSTGFSIRLAEPARQPILFSWLALATNAPKTAEGMGSQPEPQLLPFPVDSLGVPVSSSAIWNGCIRGQVPLDSDGRPFNCSRYHQDYVWTHPDLLMEFNWNAERNPRLILPDGFQPVVAEDIVITPPPSEPIVETGSTVAPDEPPAGSGSTVETGSSSSSESSVVSSASSSSSEQSSALSSEAPESSSSSSSSSEQQSSAASSAVSSASSEAAQSSVSSSAEGQGSSEASSAADTPPEETPPQEPSAEPPPVVPAESTPAEQSVP